jgi:hypothetical protein
MVGKHALAMSALLVAVSTGACGESAHSSAGSVTPETQTQSAEPQTQPAETHPQQTTAPHMSPAAHVEAAIEAEERANHEEVQKFSGLGSTKAAFIEGNHVVEGEPSRTAGAAEHVIEGTGPEERVTKYREILVAQPPLSSEELLTVSVGTVMLPEQARTVANVVAEGPTCRAWRSSRLRRLVGDEYAEATTSGSEEVTVQAVSHPSCHSGGTSGERSTGSEGSSSGSGDEMGSYSHATDESFCKEHECIGEFTTESGRIAECRDGTFSHSGGISGACSSHGGVKRD